MLRASFLMNAHNFRRPRWIERLDLLAGLYHAATDDQVVFASKLRAHFGQSLTHGAGIFLSAEIGKRFVAKLALGFADRNAANCLCGGHDELNSMGKDSAGGDAMPEAPFYTCTSKHSAFSAQHSVLLQNVILTGD